MTGARPTEVAPGGAEEQVAEEQVAKEQVAEEQERAEALARLRRGRLVTAVVAGVLAVVVVLVALLGGFRERADLLTLVAVGSVVATGPYEVTIARATVQRHVSSSEWEVVASGTARTTGTTSIGPPTGDSGFVFARAGTGGEVRPTSAVSIGSGDTHEALDNLTPGLPAVPWTVSFRFTRQPGDTLFLAVFDQEYTTPYLFSDELGWRSTREASTMTLPLEKLPDQEY